MPTWALRLLPYAIGGVVVIWLFLVVKGWHDDAQKLPQVQQEYAVYREGVETARKVRKEVSDEYEGELTGLRAARDAAPARTVRLCPSASVPSTPGTTGIDHGPASGTGVLPQEPGPDIGPRLYGKSDEADEVSARLRACQAFVRKITAPAP